MISIFERCEKAQICLIVHVQMFTGFFNRRRIIDLNVCVDIRYISD